MDHKEFSSKGGKSTSEAKKKAARENWKKAQAALKKINKAKVVVKALGKKS